MRGQRVLIVPMRSGLSDVTQTPQQQGRKQFLSYALNVRKATDRQLLGWLFTLPSG